jgi:hypothetical protein
MILDVSPNTLTQEQKVKKQEEVKHKFKISNDTEYEIRRNYVKKDQVLGK